MSHSNNKVIGRSMPSMIFSLLCLAACGGGGAESSAPPPPPAPVEQNIVTIKAVNTDQAMYSPGTPVTVTVDLQSNGSKIGAGSLTLNAYHLDGSASTPVEVTVAALNASATHVALSWVPPADDFKGYLIDVVLKDSSGATLDQQTTAVDVSSDWTHFPRYGFLTDFSGGTPAQTYIDALKRFHINAVQFYDWQWKHHLPVKGVPTNPDASWQELSNRTVLKTAIGQLTSAAHQSGMVAMQYNLIYGAAAGFADDGVDVNWGLFDTPGGAQWTVGPFPSSWTTPSLAIFNPANADWQKYILDREMEVFQGFDFDGWHADTVGDLGLKYDHNGNAVDIKTTFKPFLTAAKQRLGAKYLVMNAVSAKGHAEVNTSPIDVAYTEIWPWDGFPDYPSLKDVIDQTRSESGGKSLVVPAYMNYAFAKTKSDQAPGLFNEPGVLLTEATVLAAGGSRIELGDVNHMLCNEYFPNRSLQMSASLQTKLQRYYDFMVAYQNLLRDGQENAVNLIQIDGRASSTIGTPNTIWAYAKQDARFEVIQLINLLGTAHNNWTDTNATQTQPTHVSNLIVKYYYSGSANKIYAASPDVNGGRSIELIGTKGNDANGNYVSFTVPTLDYWSVIYLPKAA